ncbi:MAG: hypothetical protein GY940_08245 [bacterium]|nr:hypothetical protein [bacterium]
MSTKDDYEKKIALLQAIGKDQIKIPNNIPVPMYIQEALNLHQWCQQDREPLTALGLDWELVIDLPVRSGALIESEARWQTQRKKKKEAAQKWAEQSPPAYRLRTELLESFRFAFRGNPGLLNAVRYVSKGLGHPDLVQDLNNLSGLGKKNHQLLEAMNFDMALLDQAAQLSDRLGTLLAHAGTERIEMDQFKRVRDQAYTHLKEAVDPIYEHGQFAFRRNPERRKGYRSHYVYMRRKKQRRKDLEKRKNTPNPPIPSPEPVEAN